MNTGWTLLWGTGTGLLLVAYGLYFRGAGLHFRHPAAYVFYVIIVMAGFLPLWLHPGDAPGFGGAVATGGVSSVLAALLYALFVYWYNARVDDGLLKDVRVAMEERDRSRGVDEKRSQARIERWTKPGPFAQTVFMSLSVVGIVSSVAGALLGR